MANPEIPRLEGIAREGRVHRLPTPLKRIGVTTFGESGDMKGLYAKHGLDADRITRTILKFLNRAGG